jgi:hypothetical protein
MNKINKIQIMPFVNLYKNAFDNIDDILEVVKNSIDSNSGEIIQKWEEWYELGIRSHFLMDEDRMFSSEFNLNEYTAESQKQIKTLQQIKSTLNYVYQDYIDEWSTKEMIDKYENQPTYWDDWKRIFGEFVTNWNFKNIIKDNPENNDGWMGSNVELLRHNKDTTKKFAINYHLDAFGSHFSAGPKAIMTSTIYLNDDYEGGEVSYLDEFNNLIVNYKPKKGDLVVFPSYKPFFHAALPLHGNYKYFVRHFLIWNYTGSEEYKKILSEFGPDLMSKFEEYRHKVESSLGYFQKNIYMPGDDFFDKNKNNENGMSFFVKRIIDWNKENE